MLHIKICGITRPDDALLAAACGATAIGFVFWPGSRRYIDPYRARDIVRHLPAFVTPVGVFVDQPPSHVEGVAGLVRLGAVQLHGSELPHCYAASRSRVIKALTDAAAIARVSEIPRHVTVLLDSHDPVTIGGTGRTVDWRAAAVIARQRPTILSGGLRPDNVAAAIMTVRPYGVDVSSGVETSPGIKDAELVRAFVAAAAEAARASAASPRDIVVPG